MKKMNLIIILITLIFTTISSDAFALFTVQKKYYQQHGGKCQYWIMEYTYDGAGFTGVGQPVDYGNLVWAQAVSGPTPAGSDAPCGGLVIDWSSTEKDEFAPQEFTFDFAITVTNGQITDITYFVVDDYTSDGSALTQLQEGKQATINALNSQVIYIHPEEKIFAE